MTFSAVFGGGWCDRHDCPAILCYEGNRSCDDGRHWPLSPPPDPAAAGGWGDGPGVPSPSEGPGATSDVVATTMPLQHGAKAVRSSARSYAANRDCDADQKGLGGEGDGQHPAGLGGRWGTGGGARAFDGLHLSMRVGGAWRCHCGATFPTPADALNGQHR